MIALIMALITPMLTLTQRLPYNAQIAAAQTVAQTAVSEAAVTLTLALTAAERTRSRHRFDADEPVYLHLPRGTVLQHGDLLGSEQGDRVVRIIAKPEPVLTVTASSPLDLLRAAYHLGNRHVPLEVKPTYLRLSPDAVLQAMLEQLGLQVQEAIEPFHPEAGAYGQVAAHSHD